MALVLGALVFGAATGDLLHHVAVAHVECEHGDKVHVSVGAEQPVIGQERVREGTELEHEHCDFLASTPPLVDEPPPADLRAGPSFAVLASHQSPHHENGRRLFRLSPKASPPA